MPPQDAITNIYIYIIYRARQNCREICVTWRLSRLPDKHHSSRDLATELIISFIRVINKTNASYNEHELGFS